MSKSSHELLYKKKKKTKAFKETLTFQALFQGKEKPP
jgi:hypothetical protein